jgi:hypothetical protein
MDTPSTGTGSIESSAPQTITDIRASALQLGFNNNANALTSGMEVYLKNDGSVDTRTMGSQFPLGVVIVGCLANLRATIRTYFTLVISGTAFGGTLVPGTLVVPNGTYDANGIPQYIAAVSGDFATGLVINGGTVGAAIRVGILDGPAYKA